MMGISKKELMETYRVDEFLILMDAYKTLHSGGTQEDVEVHAGEF